MWISKKKWEKVQQDLHFHQCQLDVLYEKVRELNDKIHRQDSFIKYVAENCRGGDTDVD